MQCNAAAKSLQSCPTLCDPWTVAHQAAPSMGFSRKEYWNGFPFPSPGDLPDPGIESTWGLLHCRQMSYKEAHRVASL